MPYTEEQLKKIAEWLGDGLPLVGAYIGGQYREFDLHEALASARKVCHLPIAEWLHSPEGQAAVIGKLVDEFIKVIIYRNYCDEDANAVCCLIIPESQWRAKRDDPREALIAAVLKMLENE
jgi:hypothetical protein